MINLNQRDRDIKEYVNLIEKIIINILKKFGINGIINNHHHGVFIKKDDGKLYKIASIGVKFKKWISYHGFSFNLNPNLEHYNGINPCGLNNKSITSLSDIGIEIDKETFDDIAIEEINNVFKKIFIDTNSVRLNPPPKPIRIIVLSLIFFISIFSSV